PNLVPATVVLGILLACCLVVIIFLLLTRNKKQVCEHCKGTLGASYSVPHDSVIQDPQDEKTDSLNYAALEFSGRKTRGRKKNNEKTQESLYSAVPARGDGRTRQLIDVNDQRSPRLWSNSLCLHQLSWETLWLSSALLSSQRTDHSNQCQGNPVCTGSDQDLLTLQSFT
ncbi:unnamed protein product, partial [Gadus morhua 'NCC']